ncbi:MAG: AAA family ATPase, partial [Pseudomonadota bacterium]
MYLERFKLEEFPFRLTPDPSFLYLSEQHAKAKSYMESTLLLADGFVVITGEIGSGKTTLIESFLASLDDDVDTARIHQTQVTPIEFLQAVLIEFGYHPFDKDKTELTQMLNQHLLQQYAEQKKIVLIVDEAQNLTHSVLEELRLISGLETTKEKVLSIILAGQPEFNDTLNSPRLAQLAQRTRLRFHIGALSVEETKEYVNHRLKVAGAGNRKLIDDQAIAPIHYYTGGVPRLINTLCDTAFLVAFQQNAKSVSEKIIKETADELNWQERTFPIQ